MGHSRKHRIIHTEWPEIGTCSRDLARLVDEKLPFAK